ncbi:MAG TPA: hypothetical protein VGM76_12930 [Lacipirellulaceae bacterium]
MSNAAVSSGRRREELADAWPADERPNDQEVDEDELEPTDESDLEFEELPCTDDSRWDAFIPDEDECDPEPDPGDFWMENSQDSRV